MSLSVQAPKTLFDLLLGHALNERTVAHRVEGVRVLAQAAYVGLVLGVLGIPVPLSVPLSRLGRGCSECQPLGLGQGQEPDAGGVVVAGLPAHCTPALTGCERSTFAALSLAARLGFSCIAVHFHDA